MQDNSDFRNKVLKRNKPRKQIISGSYGVYDAYRWIRKNGWLNIGRPITTKQFYYIIREINKALVQSFLEGHDVKFPYSMGKLMLLKREPKVFYKDDQLVNNHRVDWDKTLNLWNEDEESYRKKALVRAIEQNIFYISYIKKNATYKNKVYFKFRPMRSFKLLLKDKIKNKEIDALQVWQDI